ncbi:unnamed protein product [Onchocerca flexuosa]|uniref:Uncharacterized protein n=1 Tax=Onchocerca flexuosa TaxID=387005 RepID=A0A183HIC9_9BILA|nr:unnamed protein product [Onchocerca flexuosa]
MNDMANILGATTDHWAKDLVTPLHTILIGLPRNLRHRINSFAQRIENICKHGNDVVTLCASQTAMLQRAASNLVDNGIEMVNEHLDDLCRLAKKRKEKKEN